MTYPFHSPSTSPYPVHTTVSNPYGTPTSPIAGCSHNSLAGPIDKIDALVQQMAQFQAMCATSMATLFTRLESLERRYGVVPKPLDSPPSSLPNANPRIHLQPTLDSPPSSLPRANPRLHPQPISKQFHFTSSISPAPTQLCMKSSKSLHGSEIVVECSFEDPSRVVPLINLRKCNYAVLLCANPPPPPEPPDRRCFVMAGAVILVHEIALEVFDYSEILTSLLTGFVEIGDHYKGHQWESGVARDSHCRVYPIKVYVQSGCLNSAHQVFAEMLEQDVSKFPRRPPAKPPHHSPRVELNDSPLHWIPFRFCRKSYGHGSYFLPLLHFTCYCVQSFHKNATGESYWLGYVCGILFEKGNYYSSCWKVHKGLETKIVVCCDTYHEAFSTFRCKLEFECASVKTVTIIHEDYEYCIYLIIELFDYVILHGVIHHFLNQSMLYFFAFNPITTTFLYVFNCWILRFQLRLVQIEATLSISFTCWVVGNSEKMEFENNGNAYLEDTNGVPWEVGHKVKTMKLFHSWNWVFLRENDTLAMQGFSQPNDNFVVSKILELIGNSILCGGRLSKRCIEFLGKSFFTAVFSLQNCVFVLFTYIVGSYIREPNLENMIFFHYSLAPFQDLMFGNNSIFEVLEELLSFLEKLLVWNPANLNLSPFWNYNCDGSNVMRKHYSHQYPLVSILDLSCLQNIVGGSNGFYYAEQSLKNKLEVAIVIQLITNCLKANFEIDVYCMVLSRTRSYAIIIIVGPLFLKVPSSFWPNCQHFKKWDPGGHLNVSTFSRSFHFKQWDPGKFIDRCNFYNLEDKVGLDGVGIDTSKNMSCNESGSKIEPNELRRPKRIIIKSGITMLLLCSDSFSSRSYDSSISYNFVLYGSLLANRIATSLIIYIMVLVIIKASMK